MKPFLIAMAAVGMTAVLALLLAPVETGVISPAGRPVTVGDYEAALFQIISGTPPKPGEKQSDRNYALDFDIIVPGRTTLRECRVLFGEEALVSSSGAISMYGWELPNGARITLAFEHGVLITKSQHGL